MSQPVPEAQSTIPAETLRAYHTTDYRVLGVAAAFTLRIGEPSAELRDCHRAHNVDCSAFVTAWNPFGATRSPAENEAAQRRLRARLQLRGYRFVEGCGEDREQQWPAEASLLVLGITLDEACRLGREFEQNALLWAAEDAVPQLILLR